MTWPSLTATAVAALLPTVVMAQSPDSATAAPIYEIEQVDESPQFRDGPGCVAALNDNYPGRQALRSHTGRVVFSFIIGPDGWVEDKSIVVDSASDAHFITPARLVLLDRRCRFLAAKKNGQAVRVRIKHAFSWRRAE